MSRVQRLSAMRYTGLVSKTEVKIKSSALGTYLDFLLAPGIYFGHQAFSFNYLKTGKGPNRPAMRPFINV